MQTTVCIEVHACVDITFWYPYPLPNNCIHICMIIERISVSVCVYQFFSANYRPRGSNLTRHVCGMYTSELRLHDIFFTNHGTLRIHICSITQNHIRLLSVSQKIGNIPKYLSTVKCPCTACTSDLMYTANDNSFCHSQVYRPWSMLDAFLIHIWCI